MLRGFLFEVNQIIFLNVLVKVIGFVCAFFLLRMIYNQIKGDPGSYFVHRELFLTIGKIFALVIALIVSSTFALKLSFLAVLTGLLI